MPVPSSTWLRSTPSKVTLGRVAPVRAARVGSRSRELASSWVTPGIKGLLITLFVSKVGEAGPEAYKERAWRLTGSDVAWPEGHSRLSDTTLKGRPLSTSQEARAATTGHAQGLRSGTYKEVISNKGLGPLIHYW